MWSYFLFFVFAFSHGCVLSFSASHDFPHLFPSFGHPIRSSELSRSKCLNLRLFISALCSVGLSNNYILIEIGMIGSLAKASAQGSHSGATKYDFYDEHVEFANERPNKPSSGSRGNVTLRHTNVKCRAREGSPKWWSAKGFETCVCLEQLCKTISNCINWWWKLLSLYHTFESKRNNYFMGRFEVIIWPC